MRALSAFDSLFSFSWKKRPLLFRPLFPARPQLFAVLKKVSKEARQPRDYCVAKNATLRRCSGQAPSALLRAGSFGVAQGRLLRAARPGPSRDKKRPAQDDDAGLRHRLTAA